MKIYKSLCFLFLLLFSFEVFAAAVKTDKSVDLSFDLINIEGKPTGAAGPTVALQMNGYIVKMQREGQTSIVETMQAAQTEANIAPYILNMSNEQFSIVYTWLTDFSMFYGQARAQLIAAFDAAKKKK